MRPQHLKDGLAPGLHDEVLRHVTEVVNLMARGQAPAVAQEGLCGASLAALPKPSGGLCPVAVGGIWRRLVSKTLTHETAADFKGYLGPV